MFDVVVIGAGITGLTVAYELSKRGLSVGVLERSDRAGGLLHTERVGDFLIEAGADSMLAQKPAALNLCEELGLAPEFMKVHTPGAFVLRGNRLYPIPRPSVLGLPTTWSGLSRYSLLPLPARMRLALEPLVPRRHAADESVASFFRRRFGSRTVDLIAQPLLGGIHAGDIGQLSMRALFPRLIDAERTDGSVLRSLGDRAARATGAASPFVALRNGMGRLVEILERSLPANTIAYRQPAESIATDQAGWRVTSGQSVLDARAVVFAAPASALSALFAAIDPDISRLCDAIPYVSTASVALAWPATAVDHPLDGTGFVVARKASSALHVGRHASATRITACTWVSSKWEHRAPPGSVLLRAFIGGAHDPDVVDLSDGELTEIARRDLASVLAIRGDPELSRVYRWRNAGPQYSVGHLDRMSALHDRVSRHRGFFVAGSGFHGVGIPDCVGDARSVAAQAVAYLSGRSACGPSAATE